MHFEHAAERDRVLPWLISISLLFSKYDYLAAKHIQILTELQLHGINGYAACSGKQNIVLHLGSLTFDVERLQYIRVKSIAIPPAGGFSSRREASLLCRILSRHRNSRHKNRPGRSPPLSPPLSPGLSHKGHSSVVGNSRIHSYWWKKDSVPACIA